MIGRMFWFSMPVFCLLLAGCGNTNDGSSPPEANAPATEPATTPNHPGQTPKVESSTPEQAVACFFDALRSGDYEVIDFLLTQKARQQSQENNVYIKPSADQSAEFSVGDVEYVEQGGAHVAGSWSQTTPEGIRTLQVVWILRKEPGGWRIAGLGARDGDQTELISFEDEQEMRQRGLEAEQQDRTAQQGHGEIREAQQPASPADPTPYR